LKTKHLYTFGSYRLDGAERALLRNGQPVALPPKDLETLLVLVERAGHIVNKEELLERVWPGVFVEEGNLARHIFNLRQVLGDGPDGLKYIETIPKRGYRFIAKLHDEAESADGEINGVGVSEPAQASIRGEPKKSLRWLMLSALSAVLLVTVILLSRYFWPKSNPPAQRAMLAVLPFENLSGAPAEDYFADGLTEEMITQLGQLQPGRLGVIARTSTVRYKHTKESIAEIGRELGVGYLLEGSVRRGGNRVRITAQLIQAGEQTHLWAETYERPVTDVLTIQREIAEKITHSLSIQLLPVAATNTSASTPLNFESYDKYLLGLHELEKGTRESSNKAAQYFQEAIAANPKEARLYAALGEAYLKLNTYHGSPNEMMPQAKAAALKALELDGNLPSAHVLLGDVRLLFDWDWAAAEMEYRRALDLNPSLPEAQLGYATYLGTLGHFDEAISRVQRAYLTDPLAIDSRNDALWIYYFSGRIPETTEQCQKAIDLEPTAALPYAILANAYAQLGQRPETLTAAENAIRLTDSPSVIATTASALARVGQRAKAKQLLDRALQLSKERYICRFIVASTYADLGESELALDSLQQAFLQRST
jgi:TolB-like protein/DNA-binding winged helix-turn-helix (wHTH) protein/tetratricopeptide (TPR) repeat protein